MGRSEMVSMLTKIQGDLNLLTLRSIEANRSVTDILSLYSAKAQHPAVVPIYTANWADALDKLTDALEKFQEDTDTLARYLDAQE